MFETLKEYVKKTKGYDLSFDSIKEKGLCYIKIYCESYKRCVKTTLESIVTYNIQNRLQTLLKFEKSTSDMCVSVEVGSYYIDNNAIRIKIYDKDFIENYQNNIQTKDIKICMPVEISNSIFAYRTEITLSTALNDSLSHRIYGDKEEKYINNICFIVKKVIDNVIYRDVPKILQESIRIHNLKIKGVIK